METKESTTLPLKHASKTNELFESWTCYQCTLINSASHTRCDACDNARSKGAEKKDQQVIESRDHDDQASTPSYVASASVSTCSATPYSSAETNASSVIKKKPSCEPAFKDHDQHLHGIGSEWECQSCTFVNSIVHERCTICDEGKRPFRLTRMLSDTPSTQPERLLAPPQELTSGRNDSKGASAARNDDAPPLNAYYATPSQVKRTCEVAEEDALFIPDLPFDESDADLERRIEKRLTEAHKIPIRKIRCYSKIGVGIIHVSSKEHKSQLKSLTSIIVDPSKNEIISFVEQLDLVSHVVLDENKSNEITPSDVAHKWQQLTRTPSPPKCQIVAAQFSNIFQCVYESLDDFLATRTFDTFAIKGQAVQIYLRATCSFLENLPLGVTKPQIVAAINAHIGGQCDPSSLYVQYNKDSSSAIVLTTNAARKWSQMDHIDLNGQRLLKKSRLSFLLAVHPVPSHISDDRVIQNSIFQSDAVVRKRTGERMILEIQRQSVYDACLAVGAIRVENYALLINPHTGMIDDPDRTEINAETWYERIMLDFEPNIKFFLDDPHHRIFRYQWNARSWLEQFNRYDKVRSDEADKRRRLLRVTAMLNTIGTLNKNCYTMKIGSDEKAIQLNAERMQSVIYNRGSKLKEKQVISIPLTPSYDSTRVEVLNEDCLDAYGRLASTRCSPVLLNMANAQTAGGGYRKGAGAQEENIFRRSNYYLSLDKELDTNKQADRSWCTSQCDKRPVQTDEKIYPMDEFGAIYTSGITVLRHGENKGYAYLDAPVVGVCAIALAAYQGPELKRDDRNALSQKYAVDTRRKIETLFAIAHHHGHDCLVLSALGCGAFKNPPAHIAMLFKSVIEQYAGYFKQIYFAIIDDHNTDQRHNPDGNYQTFRKHLHGLVFQPPKQELDANMISGPFRILEKSQGKIHVDQVAIYHLPSCKYGSLCHDLNEKNHCQSYSHPSLCPYRDLCDQSQRDDVHMSSFLHRTPCPHGGQCTQTKDSRHMSAHSHPDVCPDQGLCTNMDTKHLVQYRHLPLCDHGLECLDYMKKASEHCRSYRHCSVPCPYGGYCVHFHDQEHINDQTHPFRKPCPLTPFACEDHVKYLQMGKDSSSKTTQDFEKHCLQFSHVCPFGRECHDESDLHTQTSIHVARTVCPHVTNCTRLTDEEHLNSFTHLKFRDIRFKCKYPGAECHDRQNPEHIARYRHSGNYNHLGVVHYAKLNERINFVRNHNKLIQSIHDYTETHKWRQPSKDAISRVINWIRSLQPVHRCDRLIFESILVHGHVMSRAYMDRLRDGQFVANAVTQHPQVRKIFDRYNDSVLRGWGRDYIRAMVAIEFDKSYSADMMSATRTGVTVPVQSHTSQEQNNIAKERKVQMNNYMKPEELATIETHAITIAQASLNLTKNKTGIGHQPDQNLGTDKHVFSILGPHLGHYYGDIFIIFKPEIMFHPDSNFSIQAATTFGQSGNAYSWRPWLKDPGSPDGRVQHFHWTKLHCSVLDYDLAAAMEIMALTGLAKKTMDVKVEDVDKRWMNIDSHQVFEAHLPQLIPLDCIDHVYMPKTIFRSLSGTVSKVCSRHVRLPSHGY